ncbi:hypothetical protein KC19_10G026300 [Ceratodon purpureus]|uniref:Uncharacterized protein n=1 Tax=Ceratodon purpureus TaxID=3225 RepID=A0A8T0GJQ7_CERPU|nr:hypothetical protein KC19_10G026300 [Ceratodon purpureus]
MRRFHDMGWMDIRKLWRLFSLVLCSTLVLQISMWVSLPMFSWVQSPVHSPCSFLPSRRIWFTIERSKNFLSRQEIGEFVDSIPVVAYSHRSASSVVCITVNII